MNIVKLTPYMKSTIWGGQTLREYGKNADLENIAECWELSFHDEGQSKIATGPLSGQALRDVVTCDDLGTKVASFPIFPTLIKLINADGDLSVQVHPDDEYALKNENSLGKTEMWYIVDAKEGAGIYFGFNKDTSKEEVEQRIKDNTLIEILNFIPVKAGDCYFIQSGTVHAIGKGITLFEVQQNSNITYRLYDWGKVDKNGKPRTLHIKQSLDVLNYKKFSKTSSTLPLLGKCAYFATYQYDAKEDKEIVNDSSSFSSITFISGHGEFAGIPYSKGDTFFIPASQKGLIKGDGIYLLTRIE